MLQGSSQWYVLVNDRQQFKKTQFVFHELKHAKPPVMSFKYGLSSSLPQYVNAQPQPTSVQSSCSDGRQRPLTAYSCPGIGQGRRGHFLEREGGVPGMGGAMVTTTQ